MLDEDSARCFVNLQNLSSPKDRTLLSLTLSPGLSNSGLLVSTSSFITNQLKCHRPFPSPIELNGMPDLQIKIVSVSTRTILRLVGPKSFPFHRISELTLDSFYISEAFPVGKFSLTRNVLARNPSLHQSCWKKWRHATWLMDGVNLPCNGLRPFTFPVINLSCVLLSQFTKALNTSGR